METTPRVRQKKDLRGKSPTARKTKEENKVIPRNSPTKVWRDKGEVAASFSFTRWRFNYGSHMAFSPGLIPAAMFITTSITFNSKRPTIA